MIEKNNDQEGGMTLIISCFTEFSHEPLHNFGIVAIAIIAICLQRADASRILQTCCSFYVEILLV